MTSVNLIIHIVFLFLGVGTCFWIFRMQAALRLLRSCYRSHFVIDWAPLAVARVCRATQIEWDHQIPLKSGQPQKLRVDRLMKFILENSVTHASIDHNSLVLNVKKVEQSKLDPLSTDLKMVVTIRH